MLSTQAIAAAHGLPLEMVEEHYREACSAGLPPERALAFAAGLAQGIVEQRRGRFLVRHLQIGQHGLGFGQIVGVVVQKQH